MLPVQAAELAGQDASDAKHEARPEHFDPGGHQRALRQFDVTGEDGPARPADGGGQRQARTQEIDVAVARRPDQVGHAAESDQQPDDDQDR